MPVAPVKKEKGLILFFTGLTGKLANGLNLERQSFSRGKNYDLKTILGDFLNYWNDKLLRRMQRTEVQMGIVFFDQPEGHLKFFS